MRGGILSEWRLLDTAEGQELEARRKLAIGRLIEALGVQDIRIDYGSHYSIKVDGVLRHLTAPDRITINFGDTPLVNLSAKPPFSLDFPPDSLARLNEALPEPTYHISHEVRAYITDETPASKLIPAAAYKPTSPARTALPSITITVATGETTSQKLPGTYSRKDVEAIWHAPDSRLETKQVSGLPFRINAHYEVSIVEPVKTSVAVYSNMDGSCVEVRANDIDNPHVASALDAVVEHLFQRAMVPNSMVRN